MRMQKVNPAIGSAGIHNNFLGQTLIQPDFTALHHDEIITVKLRQNREAAAGAPAPAPGATVVSSDIQNILDRYSK